MIRRERMSKNYGNSEAQAPFGSFRSAEELRSVESTPESYGVESTNKKRETINLEKIQLFNEIKQIAPWNVRGTLETDYFGADVMVQHYFGVRYFGAKNFRKISSLKLIIYRPVIRGEK